MQSQTLFVELDGRHGRSCLDVLVMITIQVWHFLSLLSQHLLEEGAIAHGAALRIRHATVTADYR